MEKNWVHSDNHTKNLTQAMTTCMKSQAETRCACAHVWETEKSNMHVRYPRWRPNTYIRGVSGRELCKQKL